MTDPREPYGRIVHDQRLAHNAAMDRPFGVLPWEQRSSRQRELDMRIGEAVASAERERIAVMADEERAVCTDPNEGTTVPFSAFLRAQSGSKEGTEP